MSAFIDYEGIQVFVLGVALFMMVLFECEESYFE